MKSVKARKKTPIKKNPISTIIKPEASESNKIDNKTKMTTKQITTSQIIVTQEIEKPKPKYKTDIYGNPRPNIKIKSLEKPKQITKKRELIEIVFEENRRIKELKSIEPHTRGILFLLLLSDGRIASCSNDMNIKIIDPNKKYKEDITLKGHMHTVNSIAEIDNSLLVSSSLDLTLIFWEISDTSFHIVHEILKAHLDLIWKVIKLSSNRIASCSEDKTIKIWSSLAPFGLMHVFEGHTMSVRSIIQLKGKEKLVSGSNDGAIRIWNVKTYQGETSLEKIYCRNNNSLIELSDENIMIAGFNVITFLDIKKCQIIKKCSSQRKVDTSLIIRSH